MAQDTERYLRTGGDIPQIYPGTLRGVNQAIADALAASRYVPGVLHEVTAVRGKERKVIRAFVNGQEYNEDAQC